MSAAVATLPAWPRKSGGRTLQKVRRDSRLALGDAEPVAKITYKEKRLRLEAFKRQAKAARIPGKRRGCRGTYSAICADVLEYMLGWAVTTGRVFPSYDEIASAVGCAYRTAVRAVRQLEYGGWVTWQRRMVLVGREGTKEPQVHQTSNFYTLALPNAAKALMAYFQKRAAPKEAEVDDEEMARRKEVEALEAEQTDARKRLDFMRAAMAAARTPADRADLKARTRRLKGVLDQLQQRIENNPQAQQGAAEREFPEGSQ